MKPVDPRLLRHARATRMFLLASVGLGVVGAGLVVAQATLVAAIVVGCFQHGQGLGRLAGPLVGLAAVSLGRGVVAWATETVAHRASARVKSELREQLLERAAALGPSRLTPQRSGELVTLATRGVDALDDYFARYVPQLALAVVVPVAVLARIVFADWVSAAIIVATLPLIPVFMVLIGMATQSRMDRQWRTLGRLSHHFLDVVAGLPTLKVFGRAKAQAESIRKITDQYRRATLRTLRVAFVSSFALELLSTLSVALVAVSIGMRLVNGDMPLETGLVVLVLAPEAYLPIRQVGTHYHASVEGLAAAEQIFEVLETPASQSAVRPSEDGGVEVRDLTVRYEGRERPALDGLSLRVAPGETVAVTGPSGAGKSSLLGVLLGFVPVASGEVTAPAHDRIAWVPQHPYLFAGTVADNLKLARPDASDAELCAALTAAQAWEFVTALPLGTQTVLGEDGSGLSAGQRQRLALARAFLADRPLVLLDEPTAGLDNENEAAVVAAIRELAVGRTVILTAHRPALLALADRRVDLGAASAAPDEAVDAVDTPLVPEARTAAATPEPVSEAAASPDSPAGSVGNWSHWPKPKLGLAILLGALALVCATALMGTSGWLISRASQQPPVLYLMVAVTAVRTFGIGRSVLRYGERLVSHDAVFRSLGALRTTVYTRLERLAPAGLGATFRRGDLLSRMVADVDAMQDHWLRYRLPVAVAALAGVLTVGVVAWLLPLAGVVLAFGLLLAGLLVPRLALLLSLRAERAQAAARGRLSGEVVGLLDGAAELTVSGALPARLTALRATDAELTGLQRRSAAGLGLGVGLTTALTGLTAVACGAVGIAAVASGQLHGVYLAVLLLTPLAAFEGVTGLTAAAQIRHRSARSAARLAELFDAPEPVREPEHPAAAPTDPLPLRVRGLTATWPGRTNPALADVDLDLTPGRRIAVVGPSGSGKTTLANVLLRFLDPASGSVTLGGTDATALTGEDVRRAVGLCAQDAHVFDSSLRENLRLARPDASDAELFAALDAARLGAFVRELPDGLATMVGEHGANLSGGQRQRLALARALLADFPVLILDEPAEHLDLPTADALTADLLAATEGRATLLITHRLTGLAAVDEVLVLDHGRVVQRGAWDELVAVEGPLRALWAHEQEAAPVAVG
ncbi:thiol reductant ABC exporter subunit CydD [Streptacidiphilus fuscans]|uniref:Thiol reductant ABC exporter subunit CydD n=1 Tax=Streptacidiphilus fuscans TaxID=2789292 RepID=A0A931B5Y4_9ACTN|nr:thiol reductant ABC exporter subunit CydD [Streptacidiphilus fuscans]MBF9070858.1 thiol reductant ABC exporter subunit CydD [Streptacidiphilus fuscans]